jgi:hypothetical protein
MRLRPRNGLAVAVLSITIMYSAIPALAADTECLKVALSSAESCSAMQASADLTSCGDVAVGAAEMKCSKNRSEIVIRGKKATYTAAIRMVSDAWGGSWEVVSVKKASAREAKVPVVAKAPVPVSAPVTAPVPPVAAAAVIESAPARSPSSLAPEPPVTPPTPTQGFQFAAYFDAYYLNNFNRPQAVTQPNSSSGPQGAMIPTTQNGLHFYDWYSNQLGLNLAEFTIKHQRRETGFLLDLDFGQMADINAQAPATAANGGPSSATVDEVSKHIGQVVLSYTPSAVPGLLIEAGKMPTHVGLEYIKARDNWNYTRGVLFSFGGPFWHTGFHVGYALIPDKVTVNAYLYQGWNTIYENNSLPTLGAQLKWVPLEGVTWVYNYIGGPEQARNNTNRKQVHESNLTVALGPKVTLAADFLAGSEKGVTLTSGAVSDATWTGASLLGKFQLSSRYSVSPRFEVYRDSQGYTLGGESQSIYTSTITQAFQVSEGFETRLEFRNDHSSLAQRFITDNGLGFSANQNILCLSFLYSM